MEIPLFVSKICFTEKSILLSLAKTANEFLLEPALTSSMLSFLPTYFFSGINAEELENSEPLTVGGFQIVEYYVVECNDGKLTLSCKGA